MNLMDDFYLMFTAEARSTQRGCIEKKINIHRRDAEYTEVLDVCFLLFSLSEESKEIILFFSALSAPLRLK